MTGGGLPLILPNGQVAGHSGRDLESKVSYYRRVLALFFSVEAGGLTKGVLYFFHFCFSDCKNKTYIIKIQMR